MFFTVLKKEGKTKDWVPCGEICVGSRGFSCWFLTHGSATSHESTKFLRLSAQTELSCSPAVPFQFCSSLLLELLVLRAGLGAQTARSYSVWSGSILHHYFMDASVSNVICYCEYIFLFFVHRASDCCSCFVCTDKYIVQQQ